MPLTNAEKRRRRRDRRDALARRAEEWLRQERGARSEAQWHAERVEALKQDALARKAERLLLRKLALNLVNIGYKTRREVRREVEPGIGTRVFDGWVMPRPVREAVGEVLTPPPGAIRHQTHCGNVLADDLLQAGAVDVVQLARSVQPGQDGPLIIEHLDGGRGR
jgi:hypothetical protein